MKRSQPLTLEKLVRWSNARTEISPALLQKTIGVVWMDSRKVGPGDVFVALSGREGNDGHAFVESALRAGALAAVVSRKQIARYSASVRKKLIVTADPLIAIGKMASGRRKELGIPILAITGSNGKTTTRQFITAVLRSRFRTGETFSNWNNDIGVPLSLLRFPPDCNLGVLELAANHEGEIHYLSKMVKPDIAVITNIGYAHVGLFKSLAGTTRAKFEIVDGLRARDGVLLLNGDDVRLRKAAAERNRQAIFFGYGPRCNIRVRDESIDPAGRTRFTVQDNVFELPAIGRQFVYSALPAIHLGLHLGIAPEDIAQALRSIEIDPMRGRIELKKGVTFIVDCYNANPSSMKNSIALLNRVAERDTGAVVGDMLELGRYTKRQHRELGERLVQSGVRKIIAVGEYRDLIAEGARRAGKKATVRVTEDASKAVIAARDLFTPGDTVLIKGSRAVALEEVFRGF